MKKLFTVLLTCILSLTITACNSKPEVIPEPIVEVTSKTYYLVTNANEVDEYNPSLTLTTDGKFAFIENVYEGMNEFTGTYIKENEYYLLKVESVKLTGFAGSDLTEMKFYINDEDSLVLLTNVCYSSAGYYFTTTKQMPEVINQRNVDLAKFTGTYSLVLLENEGGVLYPDELGATYYVEFFDNGTFAFHQDNDEGSLVYADMKYEVVDGYLYYQNFQEDDFYLVADYNDGVSFDVCMDSEGFVLLRWYVEYDPEEYPICVFMRFRKDN